MSSCSACVFLTSIWPNAPSPDFEMRGCAATRTLGLLATSLFFVSDGRLSDCCDPMSCWNVELPLSMDDILEDCSILSASAIFFNCCSACVCRYCCLRRSRWRCTHANPADTIPAEAASGFVTGNGAVDKVGGTNDAPFESADGWVAEIADSCNCCCKSDASLVLPGALDGESITASPTREHETATNFFSSSSTSSVDTCMDIGVYLSTPSAAKDGDAGSELPAAAMSMLEVVTPPMFGSSSSVNARLITTRFGFSGVT
mmetsp:Transcript_16466/g.45981  ORF Transcript_16466/g.45981 Transcript_16466/m.45981 type:complete len:259 (+) Transcript_16466:625-1401(+)